MLGLPDQTRALLFDLDGVITKTALVHMKAWKRLFDEYLRDRDGDGFEEFTDADYDSYVDGKPRYDGVRSFLESRGIDADDALVHRLGDKKNELLQEVLKHDGVEVYDGTLRYIAAARAKGLLTAVVSSSANARQVLATADLLKSFETIVDGHVVEEQGLPGKPAPDTFIEGARRLGLRPDQAVVFEDAQAGVEAGHNGHFAFVVGVDRHDQADALREHGADLVVSDLAELIDR